MTVWLGAMLVILSCGVMGIAKSMELRSKVSDLMQAQAVARCMQGSICTRALPLPQMLRDLQQTFPHHFSGAADTWNALADMSFAAYWKACLQASGFCAEAAAILYAAGESAARGEDPHRTMEVCLQELELARVQATLREKEKGRLYAALGAALGCLLVLVLI